MYTFRFSDWAIKEHEKTNHFYDQYLPYKFHLELVVKVANQFKHLVKGKFPVDVIENSCYGHDLMEDARCTYNNVLKAARKHYEKMLGIPADEGSKAALQIAEIVRACTNYGRGRTREERMPNFVYEDILNTPGATFVKLCDRIANVEFGLLTKSTMLNTYIEENYHFGEMLRKEDEYTEMWEYLSELLDRAIELMQKTQKA
jgi:hypothetical protein